MQTSGQIIQPDLIPKNLVAPMQALCRVAADLAITIAAGPLGQTLGAMVGENPDGDTQIALDVMADAEFQAELKGTGVRWYASEEQADVISLDRKGTLALAIDPLDGSSNIDVNVSVGTLFSIFCATKDPLGSFLRPASEQIGAGYLIYGPQTALMVTFGNGTQHYVLDPRSREFMLVNKAVRIAPGSHKYSINASNYRHWSPPVRAYVDDCLAGAQGSGNQEFNMRWVASLVAETHRILARGGVFLYPRDDRPGYENGRLRMVYECAPVAMLIEQAGGKATDGQDAIMAQTAPDLHARAPLVFGSADMVDRVATYHDLPENEVSALFGSRGLFRN